MGGARAVINSFVPQVRGFSCMACEMPKYLHGLGWEKFRETSRARLRRCPALLLVRRAVWQDRDVRLDCWKQELVPATVLASYCELRRVARRPSKPFPVFGAQPTKLMRVPISPMEMRISSKSCKVNASGGTMPVPVSKKHPAGKTLSRNRYSTRVLGSRFMLSRLVAPRNTQMFSRRISSTMLVELFKGCSLTRMHGPNAQLRL